MQDTLSTCRKTSM